MSDQEKFLLLVRKVHFRNRAEIRTDWYYRSSSEVAYLKATLTENLSADYTEAYVLPKQPHKAHGLQTLQEPDQKRPKGDQQPTPNFDGSDFEFFLKIFPVVSVQHRFNILMKEPNLIGLWPHL